MTEQVLTAPPAPYVFMQDEREPAEGQLAWAGGGTAPTVSVVDLAPTDKADGHVDAEVVEGLPRWLVAAYARRAAWHSRAREADPGVWAATVVGLDGVYGDGASRDEAEEDLREAVMGWVAVRRRLGLKIPALDGLDLNLPASPGPA
ncbi:MAG TPA: type II toxin-antitoxin system HicB family antitoxin [Streptosporangiaceae bacterium]|nr:type II toxin-antitoxin system HicB family antitoxin [Streptosporangiaceae bacterium]